MRTAKHAKGASESTTDAVDGQGPKGLLSVHSRTLTGAIRRPFVSFAHFVVGEAVAALVCHRDVKS